jgi:hypothetical protein
MFFFQFLIQAGLFFTIPLHLSVALGLSAIDTGIKIIPLSVTLLIAAAGIPRFFPDISRTRPSEPPPDVAGAQTPDRPEQATAVTGTT